MSYWAKRDDGELVISQDFLAPDWKIEKERSRRGEVTYTCPDCGEHLHLVTIGYPGRWTQFFRHDPDSTCERENNPESLDHIRLKKAVFDICRDFGWQTDVEVAGPGYIADVLAWSGDRRFAFEIQLSPQSGEVLADRSEKYRAAGITPVWLLAAFPKACPFEVPKQTFGIWGRVHGGTVPEYDMRDERRMTKRWATISEERGLQLVRHHLWREEIEKWRVPQVITYWGLGGAILATFGDGGTATNPRVRLWGQKTTMADVVTRALTGEIARDFDAAMDGLIAERDEIAVREARARRAMITGVKRDFEYLVVADRIKWEKEMRVLEERRRREAKTEAARRLEKAKADALHEERELCRREERENEQAVRAYWERLERKRMEDVMRIAQEKAAEAVRRAAEEECRHAEERAARERARKAAWVEMRTTEGFWWLPAAIIEWEREIAARRANEAVEAEGRVERERVKKEQERREVDLKTRRLALAQQTKQTRFSIS